MPMGCVETRCVLGDAGGLLNHLAWVEEVFQNRLAGRESMAPFDRLDPDSYWEDWVWTTAANDTPDALRALWVASVHRSLDALPEALSRGGLGQTTHSGMSLRRLLADLIEEYTATPGMLTCSASKSTGSPEKALRGLSGALKSAIPVHDELVLEPALG